ncbi:MAG: DUF1788 domain-containing protein [Longimonas sp.]|uniref:BREX protein BrxB domain-containing protein n=1 Tax=Longimonas sp. TaxID=2039626 RepID=UPI003360FABC
MLNDLFRFLRDDDFQNPASGHMNFPAYLYAYPAENEYAFRAALPQLKEQLARPPVHQVPFILNVFDHFIEALRTTTYGGTPYLDTILEHEQDTPKRTRRLITQVLDPEGAFYASIHEAMRAHQKKATGKEKRTYAFVHGWGSIHPYLTAHQFMGCMEPLVSGYKLILFYPGTYRDDRLQFLGRVDGRGPYRAQSLNAQIESRVSRATTTP